MGTAPGGRVANAILDAGADTRLAVISAGMETTSPRPLASTRPTSTSSRDSWQIESRDAWTGQVDARYFINSSGFGFDVAVLRAAERVRWLRGNAIYLYTALRQLLRSTAYARGSPSLRYATNRSISWRSWRTGAISAERSASRPALRSSDGQLNAPRSDRRARCVGWRCTPPDKGRAREPSGSRGAPHKQGSPSRSGKHRVLRSGRRVLRRVTAGPPLPGAFLQRFALPPRRRGRTIHRLNALSASRSFFNARRVVVRRRVDSRGHNAHFDACPESQSSSEASAPSGLPPSSQRCHCEGGTTTGARSCTRQSSGGAGAVRNGARPVASAEPCEREQSIVGEMEKGRDLHLPLAMPLVPAVDENGASAHPERVAIGGLLGHRLHARIDHPIRDRGDFAHSGNKPHLSRVSAGDRSLPSRRITYCSSPGQRLNRGRQS